MSDLKPLPSRAERIAALPVAGSKPPPTLTFTDGLNFGCGFFVAGALFTLFAVPASAFLLAVLGALAARGG